MPNGAKQSDLDECLAHVVLEDCDGWIGVHSTIGVQSLLSGALQRAEFFDPSFPVWRIFGPLEEPGFWRPIVAETGLPGLSFKWATAMEMLHFSGADAVADLADRVRAWHEQHGTGIEQPIGALSLAGRDTVDGPHDVEARIDQFWRSLRARPGMFIGSESARTLHHYFVGLSRGGDWLGLPEHPRLQHVIESIETQSETLYGSRLAAYRLYGEKGAQRLLDWVLPAEE